MAKYFLLLFVSAVTHAHIKVPIKIARVPFTGEHFMYNDQEDEKPLFKKL